MSVTSYHMTTHGCQVLRLSNITSGLLLSLFLVLGVLPVTRGGTGFTSTRPVPRDDYWQQRLAEINAELKDSKNTAGVRLVFLGDSITDLWHFGASPWLPSQKCGRAIWDESFAGQPAENRALNLGISGDRTEHLLSHLLPQASGGAGFLDAPRLQPEFVILMIGINNTWAGENPMADSVLAGIRAVITAVHERQPTATVIVQSLLPTNDAAKNRDVILPVNQHLVELVASAPYSAYTHYLDLYSAFVDTSGMQLGEHFNDGVHPNESGYRRWRDHLVPCLGRLRAAKATTTPKG